MATKLQNFVARLEATTSTIELVGDKFVKFAEATLEGVHRHIRAIANNLVQLIETLFRGAYRIAWMLLRVVGWLIVLSAMGAVFLGMLLFGLEFFYAFNEIYMHFAASVLFLLGTVLMFIWIIAILGAVGIFIRGGQEPVSSELSEGASTDGALASKTAKLLTQFWFISLFVALPLFVEIAGAYLWNYLDPLYRFQAPILHWFSFNF